MKILQFLLVVMFSSNVANAQSIKSGYIDYHIKIEVGRAANTETNQRVQFMEVKNRLYFQKGVGIYVSEQNEEALNLVRDEDKTIIWKKGNKSYKYVAKDSNCCVLYSALKSRYIKESTSISEKIAGQQCHKVLLKDLVNDEQLLVWYSTQIKGGLSPIGYLPVSGVVLRLKSERITYEAKKVVVNTYDKNLFEKPENKLRFSEKAFRKGYIP